MRRGLSAILSVLLRDLASRPASALASALAMAAGVAVFVGIARTGGAARSGFASTVEALAGRATHQVIAEGGVANERFVEILDVDGVERAQPVVEGLLAVKGVFRGDEMVRADAPALRVLGIAPFFIADFVSMRPGEALIVGEDFERFVTRENTIILPRLWADEVGAREGDEIGVVKSGRAHRLEVLGIYELAALGEAARNTAIADIASAQEILERWRLDRIDLIVTDGAEDAVASSLLPGERLERPERRGERVARMVDAFRLNLLALGTLALLVGSLLIFNAAQFRVLRRGRLMGQLRCLGATRLQVVAVVVLETALFGVVGAVLGIAGGSGLSYALAEPVAQTVSDLYGFVSIEIDPLSPVLVVAVFVGAPALAALAGLAPAIDAARAEPRMLGVRGRDERGFRRSLAPLALTALFSVAIGAIALASDAAGWWLGFVSALGFLFAGACVTPILMALLLPRLRSLGDRFGSFDLALASGDLERSLSRAGGAAAALGVALSMALAVVAMVSSFEREVTRWIGATLRADVYVNDVAETVTRERGRIPDEALGEMRESPGVRAIDTLRGIELPIGEASFFFAGVEMPLDESAGRFELLEGELAEARARLDESESAVLISEPLSRRHGLHRGDSLRVEGRRGTEAFEVVGVFRDFSFDRGYALTMAPRFIESFGDPGVKNVAIYLDEGVDAETFAASMRERFAGRFLLECRSNSELRARVLEIFHRTFEVTYGLQFIATLMALVGIAVTLVGLFVERARQIATLRALGATRGGVGSLFAVEAILLAAFPVAIAIPVGAVLAWVLVNSINLRAFGWTIPFSWPWGSVVSTCVFALVAALVAVLAPLVLVRRQSIAEALRDE